MRGPRCPGTSGPSARNRCGTSEASSAFMSKAHRSSWPSRRTTTGDPLRHWAAPRLGSRCSSTIRTRSSSERLRPAPMAVPTRSKTTRPGGASTARAASSIRTVTSGLSATPRRCDSQPPNRPKCSRAYRMTWRALPLRRDSSLSARDADRSVAVNVVVRPAQTAPRKGREDVNRTSAAEGKGFEPLRSLHS
jgi:hypothetical protein